MVEKVKLFIKLIVNGMHLISPTRSRRSNTEPSETILQNILNDMLTHISSVQKNLNFKVRNYFQSSTGSGELFVKHILKHLELLPREIGSLIENLNKHPNNVNEAMQERVTDIMLTLSHWVSLLDSGVHMMAGETNRKIQDAGKAILDGLDDFMIVFKGLKNLLSNNSLQSNDGVTENPTTKFLNAVEMNGKLLLKLLKRAFDLFQGSI